MQVVVSIIIPTKNRDVQLIRAVESCINQSFKDFEVIVVDDNSDPSLKASKILSEYRYSNIHIIELNNSVGGGEARNIGVESSKGIYVTFLDSDDAFLENALETHLSIHRKPSLNDNTITYAKAIRYRCKGMEFKEKLGIEPRYGKLPGQSVPNYLFSGNGKMFTPTLFLKKSFFNQIRFNSKLRRHQDYGFVIDAERRKANFIFIDKPVFFWISDEDDEGAVAKSININTCVYFVEQYSSFISQGDLKLYYKNILSTVAILSRDVGKFYSEVRNSGVVIYPFLCASLWLFSAFIKMFKTKYIKI